MALNQRDDVTQEGSEAGRHPETRGIPSHGTRDSDQAALELERLAERGSERRNHGPLRPSDSRSALREQDRRIEEQAEVSLEAQVPSPS